MSGLRSRANLHRDVPLPAGVVVDVRVAQEQPAAADDDGVERLVDLIDDGRPGEPVQRVHIEHLEQPAATEPVEELSHPVEQDAVAEVGQPLDVEVQEPERTVGHALIMHHGETTSKPRPIAAGT